MSAFEVVSRDKCGAEVVTRHYTDQAVVTEMKVRKQRDHTGIDWRAIEVQMVARVCEQQPKPGKGKGGGR